MKPEPETADIETASDGYASRFAGPVGEWMLNRQENIVLSALSDRSPQRILDVGGGHGQLAIPLSEAGHDVTVLGSDGSCSNRIRSHIKDGRIKYRTANLIQTPYSNNSYDTVICFRFISHCGQWERMIGELCRLAATTVIIDYPTWQSVNIASPLLFSIKRRIEKNTRTYKLFGHRQIQKQFSENSFEIAARHNQFVFPMALHRAINDRKISDTLEKTCAHLGLTEILGSPTIIVARNA